jgi:hypothetical protein
MGSGNGGDTTALDTDTPERGALLRWMIFTGLSIFAAVLLWRYGLIHLMAVSDRTYISSLIAVLYLVTCGHCFWRTRAIAREHEAAKRCRVLLSAPGANAALEPNGYTRTGAAIRHTSTLLGAQRTRYRLLLMLSDGKPNDVDEYEGRYGIEDSRQAVSEARIQGIVPFCLTVDREAPAYLPSIFGASGYTLLRRPELLPAVLVDTVRKLVSR